MEKCPVCNQSIYKTQRITLNWIDVFVGLIIAFVVIYGFARLLMTIHLIGSGSGKLLLYVSLGVIGLVGWLFSNKVRKKYFEVESCTRCDFQAITQVNKS
jgi:hypothetical protein